MEPEPQSLIKYGVWDNLEVAVDVGKEDLYLSFPTIETILNYRPNSLREKIASKSLKTFLGEGLILGKISGNIVNKAGTGTPKVSLILLRNFTDRPLNSKTKAPLLNLVTGLLLLLRSKLDLRDRC